MRAKTARFYGWSSWQIENMAVRDFMEYFRAIEILTAEEQLMSMEAGLVPHIKDTKRKEVVSRYKQKSSLVDKYGGRTATVQDLAKAFARMKMNG